MAPTLWINFPLKLGGGIRLSWKTAKGHFRLKSKKVQQAGSFIPIFFSDNIFLKTKSFLDSTPCFEIGIDYVNQVSRNWLEESEKVVKMVISPNDCQRLCQESSACKSFTYNHNNTNCWLKPASTEEIPRRKHPLTNSGPKFCPQNGDYMIAERCIGLGEDGECSASLLIVEISADFLSVYLTISHFKS